MIMNHKCLCAATAMDEELDIVNKPK